MTTNAETVALRMLVAMFIVAGPAYAQIPPEPPGQSTPDRSFEVVSVKVDPAPTRSEAGPPTLAMHPSGRFTAQNVTVSQMIQSAYDLRPFQIGGGPDWMGSQLFDIEARAADDFEMGHTRSMMRQLLKEPFGLVIQRATSVMSVYALERVAAIELQGSGSVVHL